VGSSILLTIPNYQKGAEAAESSRVRSEAVLSSLLIMTFPEGHMITTRPAL
jgi:hypothetical protein